MNNGRKYIYIYIYIYIKGNCLPQKQNSNGDGVNMAFV